MKLKLSGLALVLTLLALTACARATPEPVTFTLEMTEYAFTPNALEARVGQPVTIEMINTGTLEHEIMFGRNVERENNRPHGYETDMFAAAGVEPQVTMMGDAMAGEDMHAEEDMPGSEDMSDGEAMPMEADHDGFMVLLPQTGDRATLTFTPTEAMLGEWEMGCFEQDGVHYDAGMVGTLTIIP